MKKLLLILISFSLMLAGCKNPLSKPAPRGKEVDFENFVRSKPVKPLAQIYYEHGNLPNRPDFPYLVKASEVLKNYKNYLVIDLRRPEDYKAGHIPGAYNVPKDKVLDFLKKEHKAAAYPKVVFVCYTGQTASYVTGITRLAGFDNTYVMLYGMSVWNSKFAGPLLNGVGDRYPDMVETGEGTAHPVAHHGEALPGHHIDWNKFPELPKQLPTLLIEQQARKALKQERKDFLLKADEFFPDYKQNPLDYYVICYLPAKFYVDGHIKGAVRFQPHKDLGVDGRLVEIPKDKKVLVYCKTGHTGSQSAAWLDMLGYKGHNLILGSLSFMYSKWLKNEWISDVKYLINEYPVVEGDKPFSGKVQAVAAPKKIAAPKPAVKHKKKEVTGGCG